MSLLGPYAPFIKAGILVGAVFGIFFYGYHKGSAVGTARMNAENAQRLAATVSALEARYAASEADNAKLQTANDQAQREINAALEPVAVPTARLCYYAPAAGSPAVSGAPAVHGNPGESAATAGRGGQTMRPGDPGLRREEGPDVGALFVALGALLDSTSAVARGERAAGR